MGGMRSMRLRDRAGQNSFRRAGWVGRGLSSSIALVALVLLVAPTPRRSEGGPGVARSMRDRPAANAPRRFTFVNRLDETIWLAGYQQTPTPALGSTGWILPAGHSITISVPNHWNGRFWGRTGCRFNKAGLGHCETGDCEGRFRCTGYGAIPATLAEYNLDAWRGLDFYDVSMVDGSNLPMYVNTIEGRPKDPISANGCSVVGCTTAVRCPTILQLRVGGRVVGCLSACARLGGDPYCCRGAWSSRSVCIPSRWPVDYAAVFKRAEPYAYSYVYDDATSTFTCTGVCDYRVTFGVTPTH
jgi:hypothetical protein